MQSKISPLAAVAAIAALVTPVLAAEDHLVPVPVDVIPEVAPAVKDAAPKDAAAKDAALPTGPPIPYPELNGLPHPPVPVPGHAADTTGADAAHTNTYVTYCPETTVLTWGKVTTSITTAGYVTLTDCPLNTTTTTPYTTTTKPVIPTKYPQPHPYPPKPPVEHDGEHGDVHDGKAPETTTYPPVVPPPLPPKTTAPVAPTRPPVVVSGASQTQVGIFLGVAVAAVSFAVFGL